MAYKSIKQRSEWLEHEVCKNHDAVIKFLWMPRNQRAVHGQLLIGIFVALVVVCGGVFLFVNRLVNKRVDYDWIRDKLRQPLPIGSDVKIQGVVVENQTNHELADSVYYLITLTNEGLVKVIYGNYWPRTRDEICVNTSVFEMGESIKVGTIIETYGRAVESDSILPCTKKEHYIHVMQASSQNP